MNNILISKIKNFFLSNFPALNKRLIIERMEIDFIFSRFTKKKILRILDIGAHHGEFLDIFSNLQYGGTPQIFEIFSFEPFVNNFKIIQKKIKYLNKNIRPKIYNFAISNKTEKKVFYVGKTDTLVTCESYWLNKFKKEFIKKIKIKMPCLTFADFIGQYDFDSSKEIDLLKIDVEGHDLIVLNNVLENDVKINSVMIEFEPNDLLKNKEIIKLLTLKKFKKIFIFGRDGIYTSYIGECVNCKNFFKIINTNNISCGNLVAFKD
jgi:FkbM family methyltransferase